MLSTQNLQKLKTTLLVASIYRLKEGGGGSRTKYIHIQPIVESAFFSGALPFYKCFRGLWNKSFFEFRVRRLWYGVDEVILPQINELLFDEYHICQQFVHYHKKSCIEALFLQERCVLESVFPTTFSCLLTY